MRGKKKLKFRSQVACVSISLGWLMLPGCARIHNADQPTAEPQVLQNVIQLTFDYERAGEGYFSQDMNWIIFQAVPREGDPSGASTRPSQSYQMYVAPLRWTSRESTDEHGAILRQRVITGIGKPIRISPEKSRNTCGYFSPDGNTILFASTAGKEDPDEPAPGYQREGGNYRWAFSAGMDIFRADGWQGAIAAIEPGGRANLARHRMADNTAYDAEASLSGDGKWVVFTSNRDGDLDLYAMRLEGNDVVRLTNQPGYDGGAFFSPDGKRLVYRSDRKSNNLLQIFVAEIVYTRDGKISGLSRERQITSDANVNWGPFWHPNGRHIVYATSVHGHANYELYIMRADGSRKTRLTFTPGADILPAFSPDAKYLMWSSKRSEDQSTQLFLAEFRMPKGM